MASQISRNQDSQAREQFMKYYITRDIEFFHLIFRPRLCHARALSDFYTIVEYWSGGFVDNTVGSYSIHGDPLAKPLDTVPASDSEYIRIERCLYRFDIFCKIFCSAKFTSLEEEETRMRDYLSHFSHREHEQFATIRDFMTKVVRSEQCRSNRMEVIFSLETAARTPAPSPIEYHITRGLKHILDVLKGVDWTGEDWTIATTPSATTFLPYPTLLYDHLRRAMPDDASLLGAFIEGLEPEEESIIIAQEWCPDADTGPANIWRLAYQLESVLYCVDNPREEALRDWGYVFWDGQRLEDMEVFKLQWDSYVQLWV